MSNILGEVFNGLTYEKNIGLLYLWKWKGFYKILMAINILQRSNLNSVARYSKYAGKIVVKRAMLKKGA